MSFEVETTDLFIKHLKPLLKKYAALDDDLIALNGQLAEVPRMGDRLGQNCYEVRLSIRSKSAGKSGGPASSL